MSNAQDRDRVRHKHRYIYATIFQQSPIFQIFVI